MHLPVEVTLNVIVCFFCLQNQKILQNHLLQINLHHHHFLSQKGHHHLKIFLLNLWSFFYNLNLQQCVLLKLLNVDCCLEGNELLSSICRGITHCCFQNPLLPCPHNAFGSTRGIWICLYYLRTLCTLIPYKSCLPNHNSNGSLRLAQSHPCTRHPHLMAWYKDLHKWGKWQWRKNND